MRLALALLLVLAGAQAVSAAADPCAKFSDADAYNNCLAGFGPVAKPHAVTRSPDAEDVSRPASKNSRGERHSRGRMYSRRHDYEGRHRVRMEIDVPSEREINVPSPYGNDPSEPDTDGPSPYRDGASGE